MHHQKAAKTAMFTIPVNIATSISLQSTKVDFAAARPQARFQPPAGPARSLAPWYNAELKRTPTR
jgi:hypothetical protein